jgi:alcohol dehydrogenase
MGHDADIRTFPHVPGHEFAGIVESVGPEVTRWHEGERVTVPFCLGGGRCEACRTDLSNVCDHYEQPGFTIWGSFAELVAIPHADVNLCEIPGDVDFVTAASLGCRFATAWRAVREVGRVMSGEQVSVFGCGGLGLSVIMVAAACGARVMAVDIDTEKLGLARDAGAAEAILWSEDAPEQIRSLTGGAHVSFDALGSARTSRASIESLRKRGRHVQVGLIVGEDRHAAIPMPLVISRELQILGSHGMQASRYPQMFEAIRAGAIDPRKLVRKIITLAEAAAELQAMGSFATAGITVIDMTA